MHRLLVAANVVPNSLILVTLMMEALRSSETPFLTRSTSHNIPEDSIHPYNMLWAVYKNGITTRKFANVFLSSFKELYGTCMFPHNDVHLSLLIKHTDRLG
jgi:hypothetical protein